MTQSVKPSKSAQAKTPIQNVGRVAAPPQPANTEPSLDLSTLSVKSLSPDERITRAPGAGRKAYWTPNPMLLAALQDSWENRSQLNRRKNSDGTYTTTYLGSGKGIEVDVAVADRLVNAIRKVGRHLNLGVAFNLEELSGGRTMVKFAAQTPKTRRSKAEDK